MGTKTALLEIVRYVCWVEQMPAVPGHHRNANYTMERCYNDVEDAASYDSAILEAMENDAAENEDEHDVLSVATWQRIAEALGIDVSSALVRATLHHESWDHAVLYEDEEAAMAAFHRTTKPDREEYEQNCGEKLTDDEWWELCLEDGMRWNVQTVVEAEK